MGKLAVPKDSGEDAGGDSAAAGYGTSVLTGAGAGGGDDACAYGLGNAGGGASCDVVSAGATDDAIVASGTTVIWTCSVLVLCIVVVFGCLSWTTATPC